MASFNNGPVDAVRKRKRPMEKVAIIGTGLIGRAWAMVFARAGWNVVLQDPVAGVAAAAVALIGQGLDDLRIQGLVDDPAAALARVSVAQTLAQALHGVTFVQENGPETLAAKLAIYAELDRLAPPGVVLASSTSAIVASSFTEKLAGRERCLVGHPVNPPHLVPIVEICGAPWTSPDALARAHAVYDSIGQVPISVKREIDSFILNRLQGALLAEAFKLVGEGYVSPQDLDKTIKDGLGLRWAFMGPFETIELNAPGGIEDYCRRYGRGLKQIAANPATPEVFDAANVACVAAAWGPALAQGAQADKMRWRDVRLAALVAHKKSQA